MYKHPSANYTWSYKKKKKKKEKLIWTHSRWYMLGFYCPKMAA